MFQDPLFVARYTPMTQGDWELRVAELVICSGYWSPPAPVVSMPALLRRGLTWMSTSPFEIESQEIGVRLARGHVAIFGMGLGWAAAATASLDEVTAVTVVERDADVLQLHRRLAIFDQLPGAARDKITVEHDDAFAWKPKNPVNLLMPDVWQPIVSDGRIGEVRRMQANVRADAIYFWGQELEIARHAVAGGRLLDESGVAATIGDFGLPLVGPECPGYAALVEVVARRWMKGRWLPGHTPPF